MKSSEYFWMSAKYDGKCAECEDAIAEGDRIVWSVEERKAYCEACGELIAGEDPLYPLEDYE